jgi:hypothetical protein
MSMFSLRDTVWSLFYGSEPSASLQTKEIVVATVIAVFLLSLYWLFQKIIFYGINDNARTSRTGARVLAVAIATAWLLSSLDLLGIWTSLIMVVVLVLVLTIDVVYLLVTRHA